MNVITQQRESKERSSNDSKTNWARLKSLLESKSSLESSVNMLRTKTIEQFATECHKIYKTKIKIQYILESNRKIIGDNMKEVKFSLPSIKMLDGSNNLTYYEEIEKFLFTFRSNNYLMLNLIDSLKPDQWEIVAPFLCHFFYENFYSESTEQEEILYIIYLLLEKEVDTLNTPSLYSFMDTGFLSTFLMEFSNRYEIKCYINEVINSLVQQLESTTSKYESLDFFSELRGSKAKTKEIPYLRQSTVDRAKNKNYTIDNNDQMLRASEKGFMHKSSMCPFGRADDKTEEKAIDNLHEDFKKSFTEGELRKMFEDEASGIRQEFLLKQLRFCRYSKNKNLFSNQSFLDKCKPKKDVIDDEMVSKYNRSINMVKSFINSLFDKLENITVIPYSIKCICKMIAVLFQKKFKTLTVLERNAFICEYFFGKLILPVLLNPDINELGSKMIISLTTRKNCYNIYLVLKNYIRGEFFTGENNPTLTVFNSFIFDGVSKINNFIEEVIKVKLPPKLEKLAEEFYRDSSFKLDNSNRDRSLIDYDYFEENPNDFMQHQSICFKMEELVEFIRVVGENPEKFNLPNEIEFVKAFNKLNDFREHFEKKIGNQNGKEYYVIINDNYTPEKKELLDTKEKILPLKANNEQGYVKEIKYGISLLLSKMELRPHCDWVTDNFDTKKCFESIYKITSCYEQNTLDSFGRAPLYWYALYIKNHLNNLPSNYKENDFKLLYDELVMETKKKMDSLKELNDFLTIQITSKFYCLEQKIKITKETLELIRQTELNIRTLKFIEKEQIEVCVINKDKAHELEEKENKEKGNKFCNMLAGSKDLILSSTKTCVHAKLINIRNLNEHHFNTVREFSDFFSHCIDIHKEISEETQGNPTKAKEVLNQYMEFVKEVAIQSHTLQYNDETEKNNETQMRDSYQENNLDFARETIVPENKTVQPTQGDLYIKKALQAIRNYILKQFCSVIYDEMPCMDDLGFSTTTLKYGWIDPVKHLDIPICVFDTNIFDLIKAHFIKMDILLTPEEKLDEFNTAVQMINSLYTFTMNKDRAEAGDMLPFIIYGIIKARPMRIRWSCRFIKFFMDESEKFGNNGYNLTQIESSIDFIRKIDENTVHLSSSEFYDLCAKYSSSA